jgi:hypothetical protein
MPALFRVFTLNLLIGRPFVKLGINHVDWFSLEPEHCGKNVECLFVSYCRPSNLKMPPWVHDDRRATMLKYYIQRKNLSSSSIPPPVTPTLLQYCMNSCVMN